MNIIIPDVNGDSQCIKLSNPSPCWKKRCVLWNTPNKVLFLTLSLTFIIAFPTILYSTWYRNWQLLNEQSINITGGCNVTSSWFDYQSQLIHINVTFIYDGITYNGNFNIRTNVGCGSNCLLSSSIVCYYNPITKEVNNSLYDLNLIHIPIWIITGFAIILLIIYITVYLHYEHGDVQDQTV